MRHSHGSSAALTGRRLSFSVFIALVFVLGEATTGYFSHSLALSSDAGNFAGEHPAWVAGEGDLPDSE